MSMYQEAVKYIKAGLSIFPLKFKGKEPLTKNGCKEATTDAAIVKAWWQKWPNANIGIATGSKSGGLFVIDLDIDEDKGIDGYHSLRDWEKINGCFPETCCSITGRGGYHLFFRTNREVKNRVGIISGVDIRGEGGYIVAPPSIHPNGRIYEWEYDLEEFEIKEANDIVFKFLNDNANTRKNEFKPPLEILSGTRNRTIFEFACSLQSKGLSDAAIKSAISIENQERCVPPLDEKDLEKILNSVFKYEKGTSIVYNRNVGQIETKTEYIVLERDKDDKLIQSIDNICTVLRNDELLKGKIKYNVLSYSQYVCGELPWEHRDTYREWKNSDDSNLKCYIEHKYKLKSMDKIMEALVIVSQENKFNPVIDWLESLKWDGKKRIEDLLPDYLGVTKDTYSIECMKLFMLGAINRAYRPGCKFDYMLVLTGEQGIGKSTFLKMLACNDVWYNDNFNSVDGDKASEKLRGMWIVELAELLAVKRAKEVESMKAFITSTVDTYRSPYERRTEQRPRVCVFAGTTNSSHFLTDRTGNRRYIPIKVHKNNIKKSLWDNKVMEDFTQAWAEALYIFKTEDPKLVIPKNLEISIENVQKEYLEEDVRAGIIKEWLDNTNHDYVCIIMIWELALGNLYEKPKRSESNEIHDIMTNFEEWVRLPKAKRFTKYGVQKCYCRINKFEDDAKSLF